MKITIKKEILEMAEKLDSVIQKRKEIEKEEKELKTFFKDLLKEDNSIKAGSVLISLKPRSRKNFDKKALLQDHGPEFVQKYESETTYMVMDVIVEEKAS